MSDPSDGRDLLSQLAQLAADLSGALAPVGLTDLLDSVVWTARRIFHADACSLALLDDSGEELVFEAASGGAGTAAGVVGMRFPVGHGIAGWAATSGQPVFVDDVSRDPRFARDIDEALGYVPTSILAIPLETEREVIGVIELLDPAAARLRDHEIMSAYAHQAALIVESWKAFSDLGRTLLTATAAAAASSNPDLVEALRHLARAAPSPTAELAELGGHLAELGRLGPAERAAATRLVGDFLGYVRSVAGPT